MASPEGHRPLFDIRLVTAPPAHLAPQVDLMEELLPEIPLVQEGIVTRFWRFRWALAYGLLVTGLIYAVFTRWAYDDPFITYRYAENLSRGLGLVYNTGERVLSTTTPLFAILLAVFSKIWPDLPSLAVLIGALGVALGALFLWDFSRSTGQKVAGWAALLLYPTFPLLLATLGSETPLYLAFCLGAFTAYARKRYSLMAVFTALAVLTRGDGVLVAAVLGADFLIRIRRPVPWRAVLLFLIVILPWFAFAWLYYGAPLPVTLAAKRSQGAMAISQRFAEGFLELAKTYLASWKYRLETLLGVVGLIYSIGWARRWLPVFAWTGLYFLAYTALGVSRYYWYYAPLVPGFVAAVGLGVVAFSRVGQLALTKLRRKFSGLLVPPLTGSYFVVGLLLLPLFLAQLQNALRASQHPDTRGEIYRQVGQWLRDHIPPSASVGALEVGIIGYYAQRPMVDFAGLIQPEVARQLGPETTYEDAALWAAQEYHPRYLVLQDGVFPHFEGGYVARNCRAIHHFEGDSYGYSSNLTIYTCPKL